MTPLMALSRPIAALQFFGRYWGTADLGLRWRREGSVAIDPNRTFAVCGQRPPALRQLKKLNELPMYSVWTSAL
jgi:hypothetical protein